MSDKKTILIVEDDKPLRELLKVRLERQHFDVQCAANGQAALEICKNIHPNVILLDVNLPDILGVDVLEAIKSSPKDYGTPKVIVLTGIAYSIDDPKERWAREYDVADFLAKPFDYEELLKKIETALK
ncbi:MAG: response regulator [Candidatus Aureabacteria bacterium]|nr:response regulator [Candidatus Auribacterota bacterium]